MDSATHNIVGNLAGWANQQAGYNANAQNAAAQHIANLAQQRMALQSVLGPGMGAIAGLSGLMNANTPVRKWTQEEIDLYEAQQEVDAIAPGWKD